jgi:hypothetical protein
MARIQCRIATRATVLQIETAVLVSGTYVCTLMQPVVLGQARYGRIPHVSGKGYCAQYLLELLQGQRQIIDNKVQNQALQPTTRLFMIQEPDYSATSTSSSESSCSSCDDDAQPVPPKIGHLVVLDRTTDLLSPLCTQLTYEGLLDEVFNIKHSMSVRCIVALLQRNVALLIDHHHHHHPVFVEVDKDLIISEEQQQQATSTSTTTSNEPKAKMKVLLNSDDILYQQLRGVNFECVGAIVHQYARSVNKSFKERSASTLSELRALVAKLPNMTKDQMYAVLHTHTHTHLANAPS